MTPSGKTALVASIAHPVAHLRSPTRLNRKFEALGIDAAMVAFDTRPEDLAGRVADMRTMLNLVGFCVTLPHKEAIVPLLDSVSDRARLIGAVNCVRRGEDGRLHGDQYDGIGFVAGVEAAGHGIAGRRVFLAGAGGAACGVAFALAEAGVRAITIHNRSAERAHRLVERLRGSFPRLRIEAGSRDPSGHDLVVNTTSLGMRPDDALPMDVQNLREGMTACEVVMMPARTPFLAAAEAAGCALVYGDAMLEGQLSALIHYWRLEPSGDERAAGTISDRPPTRSMLAKTTRGPVAGSPSLEQHHSGNWSGDQTQGVE